MAYRTHGLKYLSLTPIKIRPEYYIWMAMKRRCRNPDSQQYKNYGGRGIDVCSNWLSFEGFYKDMGDRPTAKHSLGRIDNDKGYNKSNCRWETKEQQDNNKRQNVYWEYNGVRLSIAQWAKLIGLKTDTLWKRVNSAGWSIEKALTTPHRYKKIEIGLAIDKTKEVSHG